MKPGGFIEQTVNSQFVNPIKAAQQAIETLEAVAKPLKAKAEAAIENLSKKAAALDKGRLAVVDDIGREISELAKQASDAISDVDDFLRENPGLLGPIGPIYTVASILAEGRTPTEAEMVGIVADLATGGTASQLFTMAKFTLPPKGRELVGQFEAAMKQMMAAPFEATRALTEQIKALGNLDFSSLEFPSDLPESIRQSQDLQFLKTNPLDPDQLLEQITNLFDANLLVDIVTDFVDFVEISYNNKTGMWKTKLKLPQRPDLKFGFEWKAKKNDITQFEFWKLSGGLTWGPVDIMLSGGSDVPPTLTLDVDAGPFTLDASIDLAEAARGKLDALDVSIGLEKSEETYVKLKGELGLDRVSSEFGVEVSLGRDILPDAWGNRTPLKVNYTPPGQPDGEKIQLSWEPLGVEVNTAVASASANLKGITATRDDDKWNLTVDAEVNFQVNVPRLQAVFDEEFREELAKSLVGHSGALDQSDTNQLLESVFEQTQTPDAPSAIATASRVHFDLKKIEYLADLFAIGLKDADRHFAMGPAHAAGWLEWAESNRVVMTEEEALHLSEIAYDAKKGSTHGHWRIADVKVDVASGFRAILAESTSGKPASCCSVRRHRPNHAQ